MSRRQKTTPSWYEVPTSLIKAERLPNTKSGNPRWRLYTESGIYLTAPDVQQAHEQMSEKTGPITLKIEGDKVIGWAIQATEDGSNEH